MTIKTITARYGLPLVILIASIFGWLILSIPLESYQASIGPDFIARIPTKVINLGVALLLLRFVIRFGFPSIYSYTDTAGGERRSEFSKTWTLTKDELNQMSVQQVHHKIAKLALCILTYIGAFFVLSQLLLA